MFSQFLLPQQVEASALRTTEDVPISALTQDPRTAAHVHRDMR